MSEVAARNPKTTAVERFIERSIFGSRWLLVPFHVGLLVAVVMLLAKFSQLTLAALASTFSLTGKEMILTSLSLIELALMASLLLMVIFSSYEGFVSRLDEDGHQREHLDWRGQIGFGVLKFRIMASIAAISGVYLLEKVIEADENYQHSIGWAAGAFILFLIASVVLGLVESYSEKKPEKAPSH